MFKLIQLEVQKYKLQAYLRISILLSLAMASISVILPWVIRMDSGSTEELFSGLPSAIAFIYVMNGAIFILFSSVLVSTIVVEEYKSRTILPLFSYPMKKKKVMASKLFLIVAWTFLAVVLSGAFTSLVFSIGNTFLQLVPGRLTASTVLQLGMGLPVLGFICAGISLLPFYVGMKTKSVPATILSALLITAVLNLNITGASLSMNMLSPLALALLGIFLANASLRRLEYEDVLPS